MLGYDAHRSVGQRLLLKMARVMAIVLLTSPVWLPIGQPRTAELLDGTLLSAPFAVDVGEDLLIVTYGTGLDVVSVTDPANPDRIARVFPENGLFLASALEDTLLFVGGRSTGVRVYSVSNPEAPELLSVIDCDCEVTGLLFHEQILYVAGYFQIKVFDLAKLHDPVQLTSLATTGGYQVLGMEVRNDTLYAASNDLFLWDVTDPQSPELLERLDVTLDAVDVDLFGDVLAVASQESTSPVLYSAVTMYDLSSLSPTILFTDTIIGRCNYLAAKGNRLCVSCGQSGFQVWDVSDASAPYVTDCIVSQSKAGPVTDFGDLFILADQFYSLDEGGWNVCDSVPLPGAISDLPAGGVGLFQESDSGHALHGLYSSAGELAAHSQYNGSLVAVADAADRIHLISITESGFGPVKTAQMAKTGIKDVHITQENLVAATNDSGLYVFDLSSFPAPPIFRLESQGSPRSLRRYQSTLSVADLSGVSLLEFTAADSLHEICRLPQLSDLAVDAVYDGRFVYVAERFAGWRVWDVIDLSDPVEVYFEPGFVNELAIDGNLLATAGSAFKLWNVSDPSHPSPLADITPVKNGSITEIQLSYPWLSISQDLGGYSVYNVSDMDDIVFVDGALAPRWGGDVAFWDDKLLALDLWGLMLYRLNTSTSIDQSGDSDPALPRSLSVRTYPNPFNAETQIRLTVARRTIISVDIVNILGQAVRRIHSGFLSSGDHSFRWDGKNDAGQSVSSGVYLLRVESSEETVTRKLMYLK